MAEFTIRAAIPADCDVIADFNCRIAQETEGKSLDHETIRAGVACILGDAGRGRYFVACAGDRIIGQVMYTREWSDWRNGDLWWLQSVYVVDDYRRQGVFKSLHAHLRREAEQADGVVGLRLYVEHDNARAQQVYERLGMQHANYLVMEEIFSRENSGVTDG